MFGHGFDKNLFRLFYAGEIQNLNCRTLEMATEYIYIYFYTWVHPDTNVCGGFAVVRPLSVDEHKHSPAKIR